MPLSPADIRNAALLSVATFAAGLLVPMIPYAGMPLAAFALAWFAYRFGPAAASALAILASLPMVVLGPVLLGTVPLDAAFVAVALLAVGPGAVWALRRYPAYAVAAGIALVVAIAFMVLPIGSQTLTESVAVWREILGAAAKSAAVKDAAALQANIDAVAAQMRLGWASTTVYTMGIGALLSVPVVSRAGRAFGAEVSRYPALPDTDLSFHLVWPTIAGLALLAAGLTWGGATGLLYQIGYNLLMIVRPALFLQGLAVFGALYRRLNAGTVWRVTGYVLLAITELAIPSLSVLGAVDLFTNIRKVPRGKAQEA